MKRQDTAAFVRALRDQLGVTQAELGDRLGQSERAVRSWECGARTPNGAALKMMVGMIKTEERT